MIKEVFNESFIFPVIGGTDTYPYSYFPFDEAQPSSKWKPDTPKREQYIDFSRQVVNTVIADWNLNYPFDHLLE